MQCRVRGCSRSHPATRPMCDRCWKTLPPRLQHRLEAAIHDVNEAAAEEKKAWRSDEQIQAHVALALRHARDVMSTVLEVAWFTRHGTWPPVELCKRAHLTAADQPVLEAA